ncbi:MAG: T9SS type A sorting domain-containing protein, partial [Candidatus Latescibacteria bacterium]|nr:T9SS type A sorting domain-containing protein [Candidatus Latescibacterota bacterium]
FLRYEIDEKLGTEVAVNDLRQPVQITVSNPIPIIVSVNIISGLSRIIAWNATSGRWSYDGRYFTYARKNADSFKELVITDTYTGLEKIIDDLFSVPIIFPMTDAFLLFSESDLYRIKEQSGVMEQLEFNENTTITDISPDGKWILFTDETQGRKQEVYNTETGEQFNVFSDDTIKPYWAKFSPDGTLICFCLYNDDSDTWEIYLYDADFSSEQPLDVEARVPYSFELSGNFPNPFNATTTITFTLPENEFTTFNIYNITGQKIRTLVSEQKTAGTHTVVWDGRDDYGRQLSSGTYITVLKAGTKTATGRMMLVK